MDTSILEKDSNCVARKIGAEPVIVLVRASAADLRAIYTLNESATETWQCMDVHTSVQQIAEFLSSVI